MGKRSQVEQTGEAGGTFTPLFCGGSFGPPECDARERELVLSWLFHTCIALQTSLNRRFLRFGMTAQEASVLMRCVEAGKSNPGHLAVLLGRDKGMVTRFVDRLEASRLVKREINGRDRRYSVITATGKGKQLARELACVFDTIREELFAGTVESDVQLLSGILPQLRKNAMAMGSRKDLKGIRPSRRITTNAVKARVSTAQEKLMSEAVVRQSPQVDDMNTLAVQRVGPEGRASSTNGGGQNSPARKPYEILTGLDS